MNKDDKLVEKDEMTKDILNEEVTTEDIDEVTIEDIDELVPQMNVNVPAEQLRDISQLVGDNQLIEIYSEIVDCIREDRKQVSDFIDNMANMVINDGDSTTASKEALVNLVKIKTDLADKMAKVADLMTRVKMKEKDTFPRYLAASQNNTINISSDRRALIKAINEVKKKKKEDK